MNTNRATAADIESSYAWTRLVVALALMTIGASGMYVFTVVLPAVQADFAVGRSEASLPYTLTMIGFGLGGVLMGRLSDRFGVMFPVILGAFGLGAGFVAAGMSQSILQFSLAQGILIGMLGVLLILGFFIDLGANNFVDLAGFIGFGCDSLLQKLVEINF